MKRIVLRVLDYWVWFVDGSPGLSGADELAVRTLSVFGGEPSRPDGLGGPACAGVGSALHEVVDAQGVAGAERLSVSCGGDGVAVSLESKRNGLTQLEAGLLGPVVEVEALGGPEDGERRVGVGGDLGVDAPEDVAAVVADAQRGRIDALVRHVVVAQR